MATATNLSGSSGWFMKAFMCASTKQHVTAVELYRRAVEILEWGRQMWKNVPQQTRGPIFDLTYIRAVKRFYMTALMEVSQVEDRASSLLRDILPHLPAP